MVRRDGLRDGELRAALERVVRSRGFAGAERRRRLLEFLFERALSHPGTLKEVAIGVEFYGRDRSTYDPRLDPVVRVDISRLRAKLAEYYATEGREDPIRIELPPGSYNLLFRSLATETPVAGVEPGSKNDAWAAPKRRVAAASALLVVIAGLLAFFAYRREHRSFRSVVVLPFLDLTRDHANEYFSDGLSEEITDRLAHFNGLRVVARTSAFAFKGKNLDVRTIGRMLNAQVAVTGSVQRAGDQLRISAQLERTSDGYQLWAESYDRSATDLFAIEDEVSQSIASALRLTPPKGCIMPRRDTKSEQAHTSYLKARYLWNKRSKSSIEDAVRLLDEAIRLDPGYAQAYAAKAECYAVLLGNEQAAPNDAVPLLVSSAREALRLDNSIGEAHAALAHAKFYYDHDPSAAEEELRRAIQLNPNNATAYQWFGDMLMMLRRFPQAQLQFDQARKLDPLSLVIPAASGLAAYFARHSGPCRTEAQEVLRMEPNFWMAHYLLGAAARLDGRFEEAAAEFRRAYEISGQDQTTLSDLGAVYALAGDRDRAAQVLAELQNPHAGQYASPFVVASLYAQMGDREHMFEMLREAQRQNASGLMELAVRPQYDAFRSDPEFRALMTKLHLPQ